MIKYCLFLVLFTIACSSIKTGSVDNDISDTKIQIVDQPAGYKDSLLEIENLRSGLMKYESSLDEPIAIGNKNQERYFSYAEAFDVKIIDQEEIENELKQRRIAQISIVLNTKFHLNNS